MVYDAEPEVVNHGELCRASGYEMCNAEAVVVNHSVL